MDNKKRNWIIVGVIVILVAVALLVYPSIKKTDSSCSQDGDCVKMTTSCCPCSSGGEEVCLTKGEASALNKKLEVCDRTKMLCAQVFNCKINSCSCVDGKCVGN